MNILRSSPKLRVAIIFGLIAAVHAVATHTLTGLFHEKAGEAILSSFRGPEAAGEGRDEFEAALQKAIDETRYLSVAVGILYLPSWPIWQKVSSIRAGAVEQGRISGSSAESVGGFWFRQVTKAMI